MNIEEKISLEAREKMAFEIEESGWETKYSFVESLMKIK